MIEKNQEELKRAPNTKGKRKRNKQRKRKRRVEDQNEKIEENKLIKLFFYIINK